MPKSYPLDWPKDKPRTPVGNRRKSAFGRLNWDTLLRDLESEIAKLGGKDVVLSSNQPLRLDGRPRSENATVLDAGVCVYFELEKMPVRFACDQWSSVRENIRAIVLHLEAMRGQERWGVGTKKQAFSGYAGLMVTAVEDWRLVLGFTKDARVTADDVRAAFREQSKHVHPDAGGTPEAMARLSAARDRALEAVRR